MTNDEATTAISDMALAGVNDIEHTISMHMMLMGIDDPQVGVMIQQVATAHVEHVIKMAAFAQGTVGNGVTPEQVEEMSAQWRMQILDEAEIDAPQRTFGDEGPRND